jgi:hypothetical protein
VNKDGLMLDSDAVIGTTTLGVSKYRIENSKSPSGVIEMEEERQTLIESSFTQDANGSTLTFTKLLDDGDDVSIPASGSTVFIYAVGNGNVLEYGHMESGSVILNLDPCNTVVGGTKQVSEFSKFLAVHGILGGLAFGALMPIAIVSARLRKCFACKPCGNKELWYLIHFTLNCTNYVLVSLLIGLAIYAKQGQQSLHFQNSHEIVGLIIFILMTIQVVLAIMRPHKPSHDHPIYDHEGLSPAVVDVEDSEKNLARDRVSRREKWRRTHIVCGILLLALGISQLFTGSQRFQELYGYSVLNVLKQYKQLL